MSERTIFLYSAGYTEVPARQTNGRKIKYISTDELASALLLVLKQMRWYDPGSYGFSRRGSSIESAMNAAYEQLLTEGRVKEVDGKELMKLVPEKKIACGGHPVRE